MGNPYVSKLFIHTGLSFISGNCIFIQFRIIHPRLVFQFREFSIHPRQVTEFRVLLFVQGDHSIHGTVIWSRRSFNSGNFYPSTIGHSVQGIFHKSRACHPFHETPIHLGLVILFLRILTYPGLAIYY